MGKANQLNAEIGNPVKTHGRIFFVKTKSPKKSDCHKRWKSRVEVKSEG